MQETYKLLIKELELKKGTNTLQALELLTLYHAFEEELYYRSLNKKGQECKKSKR